MKKEHHAFENQIFEHFRSEQNKIKEDISLLKENGYSIYKKEVHEKEVG